MVRTDFRQNVGQIPQSIADKGLLLFSLSFGYWFSILNTRRIDGLGFAKSWPLRPFLIDSNE